MIKAIEQPSDGHAFTLKLETTNAGSEYKLSVDPPPGTDRQIALAQISAVLADGIRNTVKFGLVAE